MRSKVVVLSALCLALLAPASAAGEVIVLDASIYRNDTVQVHTMDIGNGTVKSMFPDGDYTIALLDEDGEQLYAESFFLSFQTTYFRRGGGTSTSTTEPTIVERRSFRVPALPEATTLEIARENSSIFTASIPDRVCGADGICTSYCRYEDRFEIEPDCERTQTTEERDGVSVSRIIIGILLFLLAVAVYVYGIRGKNSETDEQPLRT